MKTWIASTILSVLSLNTFATVESGHFFLTGSKNQYALQMDPTPAGGWAGVEFEFSDGVWQDSPVFLGGGLDVYLAQAGQSFTNASIAANDLPPIVSQTSLLSVDVGEGDFYVAVRTWEGKPLPPPPDVTPVFGWALIHSDADGLTLAGSAVAYGETGIVVGTTQAVPEPAPGIMVCLGVVALGFGRRRVRALLPVTSRP